MTAIAKTKPAAPRVSECGPTPETLAKYAVQRVKADVPGQADLLAIEPAHWRLLARRLISRDAAEWCDEYARQTELEAGAREPGNGEGFGPIVNRQVLASEWLRLAHRRITLLERDLLISACVKGHRRVDCAIVASIFPRDDETMAKFDDRVGKRVDAAIVRVIERASGFIVVLPK